MRLACVLFFLFIAVASGQQLRNKSLEFSHFKRNRLRLLSQDGPVVAVVRTKDGITKPLGVVASRTYVLKVSASSVFNDPDTQIAFLSHEHKASLEALTGVTSYFVKSASVPAICAYENYTDTIFHVECDSPRYMEFISNPDVISVDPFIRLETFYLPYDPRFPNVSVASPKRRNLEQKSNPTILVADTCLDPSHCAYPGVVVKNVPGWTVTSAVAGSHGSAVAGIAAGKPCIGVQGKTDAPLVFGAMTPDGSDTLQFTPGHFESFYDGISTSSNSWGSTASLGGYDILCQLYDIFRYANPYKFIAFAFGNGGNSSPGTTPGTAKNVMPVGALNPDLSVASFSSAGTSKDGRKGPRCYTFGVNILAPFGFSYPTGQAGHANFWPISGTSAACPAIAGRAAEECQQRETCPASLISAVILGQFIITDDVPLSNPLGDLALLQPLYDRWAWCYKVTEDTNGVFSMFWDDVPAESGVTYTLINDLDVVIVQQGYSFLHIGEEGAWNHENFSAQLRQGNIRILAYAFNGETTLPPVNFSIHTRLSTYSLEPYVGNCSTCHPGETDATGCEVGKIRQCQWDGTFTECSLCDLGYRNAPNGTCICDSSLFFPSGGSYVSACPNSITPAYFKASKLSNQSTQLSGSFFVSVLLLFFAL